MHNGLFNIASARYTKKINHDVPTKCPMTPQRYAKPKNRKKTTTQTQLIERAR